MKKKRRNILSVILVIGMLMTLVSGCGSDGATQNADVMNQGNTADGVTEGSNADGTQSDEPTAMGRYVENVTDMSDKIAGYSNEIYLMSDGTIIMTEEGSTPFLISKDNGESWSKDDWAWHKSLIDKEAYIARASVGADGTIAIICDESEEGEYEPTLRIITPDGTEIPIETPSEAGSYPHKTAVADDGRVFVSFLGGDHVYEAKTDGSCELFLTMERRPDFMRADGGLLIIDGYDYGAPLLYDLEKDEYVEDEVFKNFCSENYSSGNTYGSSVMEVYFFQGEKGVIYIAGKKGLHRHVIGGSAVEQVIDGNLCTFSNPAYGIGGMILLPDNEFMTIFGGSRLVHFVYDKDVPTVPNERLKIYSFKENDVIRQAISLYQTANPEIFVEYEVGMEEGSSITREDALKNLNTKVMAGEGADIFILDDMPLNSYIEKGMLMDLSSFIDSVSAEDELFGNIVDAMKTDGKLYAMPCDIQIPVICGEEKYTSMVNDLSGIADMVEALRKDNPGEDLINICSERGIMRYFAVTSAPAWITSDNEIDKEAVTEFLRQTKRIYDAELDGLPEDIINRYKENDKYYEEEYGTSMADYRYFRLGLHSINYIGGYSKIVSGSLYGISSYSGMTSINRVKGFEDSKWTLMNGQCKNVFCAETLMGINAASQFTSYAQDFIKLCLGRESQSGMYDGLMVNKAAFDESFADTSKVDEDGAYLWESSSSEDGIRIDLVHYWPDEAQTAELKSCMESLDTPYIENTVIEDAVYEEGGAYFRGEKSLEDAVAAIEKKVGIYLAE